MGRCPACGDLLISSITVAEILYGSARMPDGKRKQGLLDAASVMFDKDFAGSIRRFEALGRSAGRSLAGSRLTRST